MEHVYKVGNFHPIIEDVSDEPIPTEEEEIDNLQEPAEDPEDNTVEKTEEEPTEEQPEDTENPYKDYSEAAVYSVHLKETGFFPEDFEIKKDISHHDLMKEMIAKAEEIGRNNVLNEIRSKWDDEVLSIAEYLSKGGDPMVLDRANYYKNLSSAKLESDEDKAAFLMTFYQHKGIEKEEAQALVDTARDSGKLDEKINQGKQLFKSLHEQASQSIKIEEPDPALIKRQIEERNTQVKTIVSKGELGPFKLSDKEKTDLVDFVTNPRYLITETLPDGRKANKYATGLERAFGNVMNDLSKQLILAKVLMDDFDMTSIKQEVKTRTLESALDYLNRTPKKSKVNPYYRD